MLCQFVAEFSPANICSVVSTTEKIKKWKKIEIVMYGGESRHKISLDIVVVPSLVIRLNKNIKQNIFVAV